ncbi:hypothetical protein ACFVFQ_22915 [Streptomyces sp. NPDC057743]|uniref:hypothetical protein n=1 Tax=Streptomyces sp. NPDC057743 TaxID=3346236 RepID=UPI003685A0DB
MKYDVLQIAGMALLVISAQAAVRLLLDHDNTGPLGWFGAGFPVLLTAYLAVTAVGVLLTGWSHTRAKALGRRK